MVKKVGKRIIRLLSIVFALFSLILLGSEIFQNTLKNPPEIIAFYTYVSLGLILSFYSYFKTKTS